jgi:tRNA (guanine10-N2)-dimethyltransferase
MDTLFYLSGEHEALPRMEVLSLLKHHHIDYEVLEDLDQILVCRVDTSDHETFRVLGMTHSIHVFHGSCERVRVQRIGMSDHRLSTLMLEREIGSTIDGNNVDLKNPDVQVQGFLSEDRFILARLIQNLNRSEILKRTPHRRPYFHPSSLSPILSRTLCNICGVIPGKTVFDPFCGTGGLLIEAGLLGAELHGSDIESEMISGCRQNLAHYRLKANIEKQDATELKAADQFDIVITDPPYGRASTTMGRGMKTLYQKAAESIYSSLKPGGTACILSPNTLPLEKIVSRAGFNVRESQTVRVHKSLTRKIVILNK